MRTTFSYPFDNPQILPKLLYWSKRFDRVCLLNSNISRSLNKTSLFNYYSHDMLLAAGSKDEVTPTVEPLSALNKFYTKHKDWLFGFLSYDIKNEIESLSSENQDFTKTPLMHFFCPQYIIEIKNKTLHISAHNISEKEAGSLYAQIINQQILEDSYEENTVCIRSRIDKKKYIETVSKLKEHILRGDIYEINYCQEFFGEKVVMDPRSVYLKLNAISPTPFSCYYRLGENYLISASPERFLKKTGSKIISQPIKGTSGRGKNPIEDKRLKNALQKEAKELSENVMIVDLVRNDLSRVCEAGSIKVEELFGIYTFEQVHQMISTVSGKLKAANDFIKILRATFPMGSMTGAPKVQAMRLIEQYETSKRGLYSGSVGYISPEGDFDFNVVIRSMLYNTVNHYLSFTTGSAITCQSVAEKEYEECLLKAKAILHALAGKKAVSSLFTT